MTRAKRCKKFLVVALAAAFAAEPASAIYDDRFEIYLSETITRDSNIFRLSRERDPERGLEEPEGGDTWLTTALGGRIDIPYDQHRFFIDYAKTDHRYRNFKQLDYRGYDGRGFWSWTVPDKWSSRVGVLQSRVLGSFADSSSAVPNFVRNRQALAEASWLPGAVWRLQGQISDYSQKNSRFDRLENDIDILGTEVGLHYVLRPGDSFGIGARYEDGEFPNRQFVAGSFFDNAYKQKSFYVQADRAIGAFTTVSARVGPLKREYAQLPQRDFDGTFYRVSVDWRPTVKSSVLVIAQRDISVAEDLRTSFVLINGITVRPEWRITEKMTLSGAFDYGRREYLGDPRFVIPGLPPSVGAPREDRVRSAALAFSWRPYTFLTLIAAGQRETRTSSAQFVDFETTIWSLQGRLSF